MQPTTLPRKKSLPAAKPTALRFIVRDELPQYGESPLLDMPERIYSFFKDVIETEENFEPNKEHVIAVSLNSRLRVIGYNIVSVGTVNQATAHPREILRPVLISGAYGFVLLHNHPGGDASPSRADEQVTRRIFEAAGIMQVALLDHVICGVPSPGRSGYYSFREAGMIA